MRYKTTYNTLFFTIKVGGKIGKGLKMLYLCPCTIKNPNNSIVLLRMYVRYPKFITSHYYYRYYSINSEQETWAVSIPLQYHYVPGARTIIVKVFIKKISFLFSEHWLGRVKITCGKFDPDMLQNLLVELKLKNGLIKL